MMTHIGLTWSALMSKAPAMGIQQLPRCIFALLARLNVGTAISATTAGRMPLNMAAIQPTYMNGWKTMAMSRMMMKEGNTAPRVV